MKEYLFEIKEKDGTRVLRTNDIHLARDAISQIMHGSYINYLPIAVTHLHKLRTCGHTAIEINDMLNSGEFQTLAIQHHTGVVQ